MGFKIHNIKRRVPQKISSLIYRSMLFTAIPGILILGVLCLFLFVSGISHLIKSTLDSEINLASERVTLAVKVYKNIAEDLGTVPLLSDDNVPDDVKREYLESKCKEYNLLSAMIADPLAGINDYFEVAWKGETCISDPIISSEGEISILVCAPLWENGIYGGKVKAVIAIRLHPYILDEIVDKINFGKHTQVYVINSEGTVIAAKDKNMVIQRFNNQELARTNKNYIKYAEIDRKTLEEKNVSFKYKIKGKIWRMAGAYINQTPDWYIQIHTLFDDFLLHFQVLALFIIGMACASFLFVWFHAKQLSNKISKPSEYLAMRLKKAADGDFTSSVKVESKVSEIKMIAEATQRLVVRMNMTLNGNDLYMNKLLFSDLVDENVLKKMVETYRTNTKANIVVRDIDGKIIAGEENPDPEALIHSRKIMINERSYGVMELTALPGCTLSEEELAKRLKGIVFNMELFGCGTLEKNLTYKMWKENEQVNIRQLMAKNAEVVENAQKWIKEMDKLTMEKSPKKVKTDLLFISAHARELLEEFQDSSAYAQFSSVADSTKDEEYSLNNLSDTFKRGVNFAYMNGETESQVSVSCNSSTTVFGDRHTVESVLTQLVGVLSKEKAADIKVVFDHEDKIYSDDVIIRISAADLGVISEEITKFKLWKNTSLNLDVKDLNFLEQQVVSALKMLERIGGSHTLSVREGKIELTMKVPQLKVSSGKGM